MYSTRWSRPPAPMTQHPRFDEEHAIRKWVYDGEGHDLLYAESTPVIHTTTVEFRSSRLWEERVLHRYKARGLAPWTERPFVYEWSFAVDGNRWVAGPARVDRTPRW